VSAAVDSEQDTEATTNMAREVIIPAGVTPGAILSPGIRVGDLVWTAGHVGRNPETGETPDDIKEQTRNTLNNLKRVLEAAGSSLANVIKVNIYLADIKDRPAVNEVYLEYFPKDPPSRTCVGNAGFDGNTLIEIECVAVVNS
jgi:2-iminobutanoate/2-iminopropanoate deaminase